MKDKRNRDTSESESIDEVCIIKVRREVLAPQLNTDITRQPEEIETEEQKEVSVLREIEFFHIKFVNRDLLKKKSIQCTSGHNHASF